MGKKKGNSNETEAAQAITGALEPAVSPEHDASAAAPVVESDGAGSPGAGAGEHQGQPAGAAGVSVEPAVADGAEGQDAGSEAGSEALAAPERTEEVSDASDDGTIPSDAGDALGEGAAEGKGGASGNELGAQPDPDGGSDNGSGLAADGSGDDGSGTGEAGHDDVRDGHTPDARDGNGEHRGGSGELAGGHDAGLCGGNNDASDAPGSARDDDGAATSSPPFLGDVDRRALLETPPINGPGNVSDGITLVAHIAGSLAAWLQNATSGEPMPEVGMLSLEMGEQLYAFTDKIRERATPDVLASQLVILKYREHQDLNLIQRVTLEVFTSLSLIMLKQEDDIAEAMRAALETKPDPRPVPIDETTMETTDDPLATWER